MATPTKAELIAALVKQGIPLTGDETIAELKVLVVENATILTDPFEIAEAQADPAAQEAIAELPLGIIKKYMQNGIMYHRIRHEGGRVEDVKIG